MFAVLRIRGIQKINGDVAATLRMMNLKASNNCVLLPENDVVKGMIRKTKDRITWGEIDKETLSVMLKKRLRAIGSNDKVDEKKLKDITKFDSFDSFAEAVIEGKADIHKNDLLRPTLRLTPPSKGFKSVVLTYPKGDLGYRGKEINKLLVRMI
jgi:large subunit ribosomal protein L30